MRTRYTSAATAANPAIAPTSDHVRNPGASTSSVRSAAWAALERAEHDAERHQVRRRCDQHEQEPADPPASTTARRGGSGSRAPAAINGTTVNTKPMNSAEQRPGGEAAVARRWRRGGDHHRGIDAGPPISTSTTTITATTIQVDHAADPSSRSAAAASSTNGSQCDNATADLGCRRCLSDTDSRLRGPTRVPRIGGPGGTLDATARLRREHDRSDRRRSGSMPSMRATPKCNYGACPTAASRRGFDQCPDWDSNPDRTDFEAVASANWATGACRDRG